MNVPRGGTQTCAPHPFLETVARATRELQTRELSNYGTNPPTREWQTVLEGVYSGPRRGSAGV
jgi:hypothetical protein